MSNPLYAIQYDYSTGDSYGSEDATEQLEMQWEDLNTAKANLMRIKEHYEQNRLIEALRDADGEQGVFNDNQGKDWFVGDLKPCVFIPHPYAKGKRTYQVIDVDSITRYQKAGKEVGWIFDNYHARYCLKLYSDAGKPMQIRAPWLGHFERLYGAKIVAVTPEESDMEFTV